MTGVERSDFIAAMRNVASSVSVVTTGGKAGRHGATVSSFCSVSADPPMVLVCLNRASRIAALVRQNGTFAVNVLPAGAGEIADRFAGRQDADGASRFDGLATEGIVPMLSGATVLRCALTRSMQEGSHLICVGAVEEVSLGAPVPLTYLGGRYRDLVALEGAA